MNGLRKTEWTSNTQNFQNSQSKALKEQLSVKWRNQWNRTYITCINYEKGVATKIRLLIYEHSNLITRTQITIVGKLTNNGEAK